MPFSFVETNAIAQLVSKSVLKEQDALLFPIPVARNFGVSDAL